MAETDKVTGPKAVPDPEPVLTFDLDRVLAEREATPDFTFKFGGEVYTLPPRPDVRAAAAMSAGRLDDGLRMLLGDEQWTQLQSVDAVFDDKALLAVMEAYQKHTGDDLGESKASTRSSRSTAKK